jgi:4-amino-4-deoxychorismate lyase
LILVDGKPVDHISALDRGLAYGDGVFRTLLLRAGGAVAWPLQYATLMADCARLQLRCPAEKTLCDDLLQIAAQAPDCVVKIIVTRGIGQRGYTPPVNPVGTRIVSSSTLPRYPQAYHDDGIVARVCNLRLARQPALAGIKHLNRLENVLARSEWQDTGIAEGILLDAEDQVIGGCMSNLFIRQGNSLLTPALSHSGIAGVTRARLLALAPQLGLRVQVQVLTLPTLLAADEVMLCNSVIGIWRVRQLEDTHWRGAQHAPALRTLLEQNID